MQKNRETNKENLAAYPKPKKLFVFVLLGD
jgi:hypothetical protein